MDPGIIELIATAGAGAVAGIGSYYLFTQSKDKKANILSRNTIRKLGLDPNDKDIINIFTLNKDKRISKAEEIMEVLNQTVSTTKSEHDESSDAIKDLMKDLERVRQSIEKCSTDGDREILIATDLAAKLKHIATEMMNFSTTLDLFVRQYKKRIFWNIIRQGDGREITINAMTKRDGITIADDARLDEILKTAQKTLQLGQSNLDKAVEKYVDRRV